jgi:hypothetical protein
MVLSVPLLVVGAVLIAYAVRFRRESDSGESVAVAGPRANQSGDS